MKIGIFFGGQSREREISFAGGRTVYDNLNKALFEPVPIFVDSLGHFILLDWQYVYKGTIRDFYPPAKHLPHSELPFQVYIESLGKLSPEALQELISEVGRKVEPHQFRELFDFAFLALHGPYGEDGNLQGLLEWYDIPYSGCGILPSAIGINKIIQKKLMEDAGFHSPKRWQIGRQEWLEAADKNQIFQAAKKAVGLPIVVKAPNQGSSIGVSILRDDNLESFTAAMNKSLFLQEIDLQAWQQKSLDEKIMFLAVLTDIREGIGMPVYAGEAQELIHHPSELMQYLDEQAQQDTSTVLTPLNSEETVLLESFIKGKEFSCIVVQNEKGQPMALPPTQIIKGTDVFDYRAKYLPGVSRKITPIDLPVEQIQQIRQECCRLFEALHANVYARIDGFITEEGTIFLNDPNTTSGMLPSSFFFHQAAEIGLNPSQFLTYIIRTSLAERIKTGKRNKELRDMLQAFDAELKQLQQQKSEKVRVAVIMGGYSSERHISVESGRNIFEKLASSVKYQPVPVFLTGSNEEHKLYQLPVNIMLKDNADDIKEKIEAYLKGEHHPLLKQIIEEARPLVSAYVDQNLMRFQPLNYEELANTVDAVFIALHGRPGEDGALQAQLERVGLPYNGSGIESSQLTINKYDTNKRLREHGILVAKHRLVSRQDWNTARQQVLDAVIQELGLPLIAKPSDDGCSSAVKKIKTREELEAFGEMIFRDMPELLALPMKTLKLKASEEFPQKEVFLVEEFISKNGAKHFLEVTGGMLTIRNEQGETEYEVFEPSESLAGGEVLSLEEKFLAGEGQNITPARYARTPEENRRISADVRRQLEKVARIANIEGYARIDAFVRVFEDGRVETVIIEINSLPGMTPATCIFHQSALNGYKPYEFIDAILTYGIERQRYKATV
ncbi:D-alanine--D-alanine ligase [Flammeovirgaceae bacterium 311]|nr:D-alanine--D-alanine ligase [Flammeovirgaceae bacterium 311]